MMEDVVCATQACATVEVLEREMPEFISLLPLPPNLPDLNPVDYRQLLHTTSLEELELKIRLNDPMDTGTVNASFT